MRPTSLQRPRRLSRSSSILAAYGGLSLLAILWGTLRDQPHIYLYRPGPLIPSRVLLNLCIGVGGGLLVVFCSRYAVHRFQWGRTLHQEFRHLLGSLTGREILVLALASSIGEECFFRGAMVPHLGVLAASVLFALAHIGPGARFLPWTLSSFVVGLMLGAQFRWSGDLSGPIAAHFTVNYLNLHHIARHDLG